MNNQYSDNEREKTYGLAEHIDTQLKQMSGDIKEVLELRNIFPKFHQVLMPAWQILLLDLSFLNFVFRLSST